MPETPQKIPSSLPSPASENLRRLSALFPSIIKDGEVDFTALKEELGIFEEIGKEHYELTWAGKQQAKRTAAEPVTGRTLKYVPEESKNAETTENLYIEGDNLEALKLLQNGYMGKIKMIYIDPPYNIGDDRIYKDNFIQSVKESEQAEGNVGEDGDRFIVNSKTSARYHTIWLSMMYPRLRLAKNLLRDDGVIFISIDDNEMGNLREICDEIFGWENFVANIVWQKKYSPQNDATYFSDMHDHILCFAKNKKQKKDDKFGWTRYLLPRTEEQNARYKNPDNDPRGVWKPTDLSVKTYSASYDYEIISPSGKIINPPSGRCWVTSQENMKKLIDENRIWFGNDGNNVPSLKKFLTEVQDGSVPTTWWTREEVGDNQSATQELIELFGGKKPFDTPKPAGVIQKLLRLSTKEDDLILDFFSGSATTAQAIMHINAEDGEHRKFIMIQYPEQLDDTEKRKKENKNAIEICDALGVPRNICEIGKERIRRAGEKIRKEHPDVSIDTGFKVLRTADTNIRWIAAETGQTTLEDALTGSGKDLRDFMPGTNDVNVVYEILLRQYDVKLTEKIESRPEIGSRTYSIADTIIICLEEHISEKIIDKIAAIEPVPHKIIFRDSAFDDDITLKENTMMRLDALMQKHSVGGRQPYTVEFL